MFFKKVFITLLLIAFSPFAITCDFKNKVYSNETMQLYVASSFADIVVGQAFTIQGCLKDNNDNLINFSNIGFDASMPAHKHGMNYRPKVTLDSLGIFTVENILLHMPGRWQMEFEVTQADQKQSIFVDHNL